MSGMSYEQGDLVLLIVATTPKERNFKDAAEQVYHVLKGKGYLIFQVEVQHVKHSQNLALSSERLSDTTVECYEAVRLNLREAVEILLGPLVCAFSLYMCKKPEGDPKPTVVVLVKPGSIHNWVQVKVILESGLSKWNCRTEVEVLPGWIQHAEGGLPQLHYGLESQKPQNGASIGIQGSQSAGTLGGFVQLTMSPNDSGQGKTLMCGMTNHHVVQPNNPKFPEKVDASAVMLQSNDNTKAHIQYPSALDLQATIENYKNILKEHTVPKADDVLEGSVEQPISLKKSMVLTAVREQYEALLNVCQRLEDDQTIGRVLVTSGLSGCPPLKTGTKDNIEHAADQAFTVETSCDALTSHTGHWKHDWALIELHEGVFTTNKPAPASQLRGKPGIYTDDDSAIIDTISTVEPEMWVAFTGRTSGVVSGYVARTKIDCKWTTSQTSFWSNEHQIIPSSKSNDSNGARAGDSGSWVISEDKGLVGMVHGLVGGTLLGQFLFTPMDVIFEDIERLPEELSLFLNRHLQMSFRCVSMQLRFSMRQLNTLTASCPSQHVSLRNCCSPHNRVREFCMVAFTNGSRNDFQLLELKLGDSKHRCDVVYRGSLGRSPICCPAHQQKWEFNRNSATGRNCLVLKLVIIV